MAVAETKDEVTAANVRKINRTEKTITITIIKKIISITIAVGDTITGGAISFSVAENRVKTEIMVAAIETLTIFIGAGIYSFKNSDYVRNFYIFLNISQIML